MTFPFRLSMSRMTFPLQLCRVGYCATPITSEDYQNFNIANIDQISTSGTDNGYFSFPQQGDLRLSGPSSGQGAGSRARTRDRRVPADFRADSQATVLPTPVSGGNRKVESDEEEETFAI
ncbi:hypothetical protein PoB_006848900 [Plakobranchus ocellatus]|uniref:Uncharacterized protein n=1 Tax=Plakobranchus ocellatus TaxID=259542 RepID=A0AAV4DCW7_9GAST|nr:hypothetical protein PoB_006848900 [Plakobranchus ocellatus]